MNNKKTAMLFTLALSAVLIIGIMIFSKTTSYFWQSEQEAPSDIETQTSTNLEVQTTIDYPFESVINMGTIYSQAVENFIVPEQSEFFPLQDAANLVGEFIKLFYGYTNWQDNTAYIDYVQTQSIITASDISMHEETDFAINYAATFEYPTHTQHIRLTLNPYTGKITHIWNSISYKEVLDSFVFFEGDTDTLLDDERLVNSEEQAIIDRELDEVLSFLYPNTTPKEIQYRKGYFPLFEEDTSKTHNVTLYSIMISLSDNEFISMSFLADTKELTLLYFYEFDAIPHYFE